MGRKKSFRDRGTRRCSWTEGDRERGGKEADPAAGLVEGVRGHRRPLINQNQLQLQLQLRFRLRPQLQPQNRRKKSQKKKSRMMNGVRCSAIRFMVLHA